MCENFHMHHPEDFWRKQKPLIILDNLLIAKCNHASVRSNSRLVLLDLIHSNCSHQTSALAYFQIFFFFFLLQFLTM